MKAKLAILNAHVATLGRLLKNYPALEDLKAYVPPIWSDSVTEPSIFIAARHRVRVAELFGADGWKRRANRNTVSIHKLVDGIEIVMDNFSPLAGISLDVAPELLTGREAGITLPEGSVV